MKTSNTFGLSFNSIAFEINEIDGSKYVPVILSYGSPVGIALRGIMSAMITFRL